MIEEEAKEKIADKVKAQNKLELDITNLEKMLVETKKKSDEDLREQEKLANQLSLRLKNIETEKMAMRKQSLSNMNDAEKTFMITNIFFGLLLKKGIMKMHTHKNVCCGNTN